MFVLFIDYEMNENQKNKMLSFKRICDARHIDYSCVVCGDDNPEDLMIEKINNDDIKKIKKTDTQNEIYDKILKLSDKEIFKRYTILCYNCSMAKQYLAKHKDNDPELQEEYNKMMEKIKQEF